ncbi:MAG: hypothetical protein PWQ27_1182 [Kosmotoga sp.]|nr:hypothetical protein [Kosmotoga sp.]MDK2953799.1 hypothetical protein [Kosmotoga sp.]
MVTISTFYDKISLGDGVRPNCQKADDSYLYEVGVFIFLIGWSMPMKHNQKKENQAYFTLLDLIENEKNVCPICLATEKSVVNYFDILLYELVNDPRIMGTIDNAMGFCKKHTALLMSMGDPFGQSIIYKSILEQATKVLPSLLLKPKNNVKLFKNKRSLIYETIKSRCPACALEKEFEKLYINEFISALEKQEFREYFSLSNGLCIPHFIKIMEACKNRNSATFLFNTQLKIMNNIIAELGEFIRKNDYRFSKERINNEKDAWKRAARLLGGKHILDKLH